MSTFKIDVGIKLPGEAIVICLCFESYDTLTKNTTTVMQFQC